MLTIELSPQAVAALALAMQHEGTFERVADGLVAQGLPADAAEDAAEDLHALLWRHASDARAEDTVPPTTEVYECVVSRAGTVTVGDATFAGFCLHGFIGKPVRVEVMGAGLALVKELSGRAIAIVRHHSLQVSRAAA